LPWAQEFSLKGLTSTAGVAKLWARQKVAQLMMEARQGQLTPGEVKTAVVQVALAHELVTTHTSLVAVDRDVARPPDAHLITHQLETNVPAGWSLPSMKEEGILPRWLVQHQGQMPEHVMPLVHVPTLVALALPQTATAAPLHLLIGFMGLCLCCGAYFLRRQRRCDVVE
jgi:Ca-activated chloride channel family protein